MKLVGIVFALFALTSCATILSSSHESVTITSNEPDTEISINGGRRGVAPLTLNLQKNETYTITAQKDGYLEQSKDLTYSVGGGWIVLDILTGIVPLLIDAGTGKWHSFDETQITFEMVKK